MDVADIQRFFYASDAIDEQEMRKWLHPDLRLTAINIGLDGPLTIDEYFNFLRQTRDYHDGLGEKTIHIPHNILIDGGCIAIFGKLLHTYSSAPDEYHNFFDFWKMKDGKIIEYNIAFNL